MTAKEFYLKEIDGTIFEVEKEMAQVDSLKEMKEETKIYDEYLKKARKDLKTLSEEIDATFKED